MELANKAPFDDRGNVRAEMKDISMLLIRDYLEETGSKMVEQLDDLSREQVLSQMNFADEEHTYFMITIPCHPDFVTTELRTNMEVNLIQGRRSKRHGIENGIENDTSLQSRDRKKEILRLMKLLPKITVRELSNELSSSPRTISRDISFMINQGVLNREGGDKGGTWIVKEE